MCSSLRTVVGIIPGSTAPRAKDCSSSSQTRDVALEGSLHMRILVVDVGGTHVKILATGEKIHREFESGSTFTPKQMVAGVRKAAKGWKYEAISIGYPGPVLRGRPVSEPFNLGTGWVGFDFAAALKCPVKVVNDAAMQALGSYRGGKMLFLGFAVIADRRILYEH